MIIKSVKIARTKTNMSYLKLTLGELIEHSNAIVKNNAMSILKTLQRSEKPKECSRCGDDNFTKSLLCERCLAQEHEIEGRKMD